MASLTKACGGIFLDKGYMYIVNQKSMVTVHRASSRRLKISNTSVVTAGYGIRVNSKCKP